VAAGGGGFAGGRISNLVQVYSLQMMMLDLTSCS